MGAFFTKSLLREMLRSRGCTCLNKLYLLSVHGPLCFLLCYLPESAWTEMSSINLRLRGHVCVCFQFHTILKMVQLSRNTATWFVLTWNTAQQLHAGHHGRYQTICRRAETNRKQSPGQHHRVELPCEILLAKERSPETITKQRRVGFSNSNNQLRVSSLSRPWWSMIFSTFAFRHWIAA